jgi:hypothetical protein
MTTNDENPHANLLVCSAGRLMWFDCVRKLAESGLTPTIWMGDSQLFPRVKNAYPDCALIEEIDWLRHLPTRFEAEPPQHWFQSTKFEQTRRIFYSLCARQDSIGTFRFIEIDSLFNWSCLALFDLFTSRKITHCLFTEAPHSPISYLCYALGEFLELEVLLFQSIGLSPAVILKRGIETDEKVTFRSRTIERDKLAAEVSDYLSQRTTTPHAVEPPYMLRQKSHDKHPLRNEVNTLKNSLFSYLQRLRNHPSSTPAHYGVYWSGLKPKDVYPIELVHAWNRRQRRKALLVAFNSRKISQWVDRDFVFFPLHYEPERTTVPEGGKYFSQFDALTQLRRLVPLDIPIIVKEHYSQFSDTLQGHIGRSPNFYRALMALKNVLLIDTQEDTVALIRHSSLVAVITGTVGFEAATMGIPTLVFGHPWYSGVPGTTRFHERLTYNELIYSSTGSLKTSKDFIDRMMSQFAIPALVNPSNVRAWKSMLPPEFWQNESIEVSDAILSAWKNKNNC